MPASQPGISFPDSRARYLTPRLGVSFWVNPQVHEGAYAVEVFGRARGVRGLADDLGVSDLGRLFHHAARDGLVYAGLIWAVMVLGDLHEEFLIRRFEVQRDTPSREGIREDALVVGRNHDEQRPRSE